MTHRCEGCGKLADNVRLREKTLPTLKLERLRLCTPCARRDGWVDTDFNRGGPARSAA